MLNLNENGLEFVDYFNRRALPFAIDFAPSGSGGGNPHQKRMEEIPAFAGMTE